MKDNKANLLLLTIFATLALVLIGFSPASAWHAEGCVYCDANVNGELDEGDIAWSGVGVNVENAELFSGTTDETGCFYIRLPDVDDDYTESLDRTTLPDDATILPDDTNNHSFTLTREPYESRFDTKDWLFDSAECQPEVEDQCWLTAGGVKFNSIIGIMMAEHGGPKDNVGGNVNPGCAPVKGNWNHMGHSEKLHFMGKDIVVTRCGNVPGIPSGSESPVTPFNFIEFEGPGTLSAKGGYNGPLKDSLPMECSFVARVEDRNEPGNERAVDPDEGAKIDRYYLQVICNGEVALQFADISDNPADDGMVTEAGKITGGNMQMHWKPCPNK